MKVQTASKELRDETARMLRYLRKKGEQPVRDKTARTFLRSYDLEDGFTLGLMEFIYNEYKHYKPDEIEFVEEFSKDYDGYTSQSLDVYKIGYISDTQFYDEVKARYGFRNKMTNLIQSVLEYQNFMKQQGIDVSYSKAQQLYLQAVELRKKQTIND